MRIQEETKYAVNKLMLASKGGGGGSKEERREISTPLKTHTILILLLEYISCETDMVL